MSPHYQRHKFRSTPPAATGVLDRGPNNEALSSAAEVLREAEVEGVRSSATEAATPRLEELSVDELRKLAAELDVPNRAQITEQDDLIKAIRQRL